MRLGCCFLAAFILLDGCATSPWRPNYAPVICELQGRTLQGPVEIAHACQFVLPPDVIVEDGIDEDEAIATALSNNAAFRATLTQLGMAEGDVVQAGLLPNPNLITFFPLGVKQWEWTLYVPIETFVLRPERIAASEREYERVAHQLVQNGLNLVRDTRLAYTDVSLAIQQRQLAEESASLRQEIANVTDKRLQRGDISELEAMTARVDALDARALVASWGQTVSINRLRVLTLMGYSSPEEEYSFESLIAPGLPEADVESLLAEALGSRPDMCAAEWAIAAAERRAALARKSFLRIDAGADGNARGIKGAEASPALRLDIPLFHRNQGGVLRADAELEQALHNRDAIRNQIVLDVRTAMAQLQQAKDNVEILQKQVVPSLEEALGIARRGYESGGAPYLVVLQAATQYLSARSRLLDQIALMRRAAAELERSVGRAISLPQELLPGPPQPIVGTSQEGE